MGDPALTADRGIAPRSRALGDRLGGVTGARAGTKVTDDQLMLGLFTIYFHELYLREVTQAYQRFLSARRENREVAIARSATPKWLRNRFESFLRRNEAVLVPLLTRHGWGRQPTSDPSHVAQFHAVMRDWLDKRYGITLPTPESIDFDPTIAAQLTPSLWYVGPQSGYNERVRRIKAQRMLRTAKNIASGPVGALGYWLGGDEGSDLGALVDGVVTAAGRTASARDRFKTLSRPPAPAPTSAPPTPPPAAGKTPKRAKPAEPTLHQLRKQARESPEAAEELRSRYRQMSDAELARRGKGKDGDAMAKSVLSQRISPNTELDRYRKAEIHWLSHQATAVLRDAKGKQMWPRDGVKKLTSTDMTPEEKALGFPKGMEAAHTEARAVKQAPLAKGTHFFISGQYNPCDACQRTMRQAAERTGARITYWWPGGRMTWP